MKTAGFAASSGENKGRSPDLRAYRDYTAVTFRDMTMMMTPAATAARPTSGDSGIVFLVSVTASNGPMSITLSGVAVEAARGDVEAASGVLEQLLQNAPRGQVGWMIPIDPALVLLRDAGTCQPVFARLATGAI